MKIFPSSAAAAEMIKDNGFKGRGMENWKPVFNILEPEFEVMVVNARHIKHVPGRKTDVKDCEWIAQEFYKSQL